MKRFQNILVVPVTSRAEAPPALREAVSLAEMSGALLSVLGHFDDGPRFPDGTGLVERAPELRASMIGALAHRIDRWMAAAGRSDVSIEVGTGSQPESVAAHTVEHGHDLVIVADDGTSESAATARRILRACDCPVWLLHPGFTGSRVLAAIDPEHGIELNRLILELARSQAELHRGELRVMHAWELPGSKLLGEDLCGSGTVAEVASLARSLESAHQEWFDQTIDEVGLGRGVDRHLVEGPAPRAIHGLTVLYRTDLLVIGSGSHRAQHLGIGTTADQVLSETDNSVLVVSPPGA